MNCPKCETVRRITVEETIDKQGNVEGLFSAKMACRCGTINVEADSNTNLGTLWEYFLEKQLFMTGRKISVPIQNRYTE